MPASVRNLAFTALSLGLFPASGGAILAASSARCCLPTLGITLSMVMGSLHPTRAVPARINKEDTITLDFGQRNAILEGEWNTIRETSERSPGLRRRVKLHRLLDVQPRLLWDGVAYQGSAPGDTGGGHFVPDILPVTVLAKRNSPEWHYVTLPVVRRHTTTQQPMLQSPQWDQWSRPFANRPLADDMIGINAANDAATETWSGAAISLNVTLYDVAVLYINCSLEANYRPEGYGRSLYRPCQSTSGGGMLADFLRQFGGIYLPEIPSVLGLDQSARGPEGVREMLDPLYTLYAELGRSAIVTALSTTIDRQIKEEFESWTDHSSGDWWDPVLGILVVLALTPVIQDLLTVMDETNASKKTWKRAVFWVAVLFPLILNCVMILLYHVREYTFEFHWFEKERVCEGSAQYDGRSRDIGDCYSLQTLYEVTVVRDGMGIHAVMPILSGIVSVFGGVFFVYNGKNKADPNHLTRMLQQQAAQSEPITRTDGGHGVPTSVSSVVTKEDTGEDKNHA